ncbi:MAG: hypothetical protein Harvfovirus39_1, partial [Harvfovirus sp.]
ANSFSLANIRFRPNSWIMSKILDILQLAWKIFYIKDHIKFIHVMIETFSEKGASIERMMSISFVQTINFLLRISNIFAVVLRVYMKYLVERRYFIDKVLDRENLILANG